jgi:O-antigen/teichoic acid export membrane protein
MKYSTQVKRAIWALLEFLTSPVTQIILTPCLLAVLNYREFGLWLFAMSIIGFGAMGSFGIAQATTKCVSAAGSNSSIAQILQSSIVLVLAIAVVATPIIAVIVANINVAILEKLGAPSYVVSIMIIAIIAMFAQEVDYVMSAVLRGKGEFKLAAKIEICLRPIMATVITATASVYSTAQALIVVHLILLVGKILIKTSILRSHINQEKLFGAPFCQLQFRPLFNFGAWTWAHTLGGLSLSVIDRLIVGFVFGSHDLARYGTCTQVAQFVHAIPAAALQTIFPLLSRKIEEKNRPDKTKLIKLAAFTAALTLPMSIFIYILMPQILSIWIGADFSSVNTDLARIMVLLYGLLALGAGTHFILLGMGDVRFVGMVNLIAGIFTIIASIASIKLGLIVFALSKLVYPIINLAYFFRIGRQK